MGDTCDRSTSNTGQKCTRNSVRQRVDVLDDLRLAICTAVSSFPSFEHSSQANTALQTLNLGGNEVGDSGASALAAALQAAFVLSTGCSFACGP